MKVLGNHLLAEYYECDVKKISELAHIKTQLIAAAEVCGATVVESRFHQFSPQGVSGVVVLKESHITIHTWPEYKYAAVDIFTCGETINPHIAHKYLKEKFSASEDALIVVPRGDKKRFPIQFGV